MWLTSDELRIGLGCMRLSRADDRDGAMAGATIAAAVAAGVTVFDTAHAYGPGPDDHGHNETLLARAIRAAGAQTRARVVTKGGMRRQGVRWLPDGRAATIRRDAEASLAALAGLPVDLWLLHAPDPRTPWATSLRAVAALVEAGLVRRVGVCNVNRLQLDVALDHAPIAAVQVELGVGTDAALRGGVVARCAALGLPLLAHTPLGGPVRAARLENDAALAAVAQRLGAGAAEVALAAIMTIDPCVVPLPGARRPETARAIATAARLVLSADDRATLAARFPSFARVASPRAPAAPAADGDIVLVMGLAGAGKSEVARTYVAKGYARLNRDKRGGTLSHLARAFEQRLAAGARRAVLDNTYLTRAQRRDVLEIAARHGLPVRCEWIDVPVASAQVNIIARMLDAHGRLLEPDELARGKDNTTLAPTALFRMVRTLEPPALDEGFRDLVVHPFVRRRGNHRPARLLACDVAPRVETARRLLGDDTATPRLLFGWRPAGVSADLAALAAACGASHAVCTHAAGPPRCWCRPPLPGLLLAFARAQGVDLVASVLVGTTAAHRAMAAAVGARFADAARD